MDGGKEKIDRAVNWDGGKGRKKGSSGEMQITFAPALSDKKNKFGEQDDSEDDEEVEAARNRDETAIETYKRKERERRERKKAERKAKKDGTTLAPAAEEGPEFGGDDVGAGGFDDAFFADGNDEETFAAFDAGDDLDENGKKLKRESRNGEKEVKKLSKREKREAKEEEERVNKVAQAALALLVDSDDEDAEDGGRHFDMRAILKAEKNAGKKNLGKGKKARREEESTKQDAFEIDVKDDRFKGVYEDSNYAIDPTNPR